MKKTYSEKLLDPKWQKKRLEVLDAAGWMCQYCSESEKTLHVHHTVYIPKREPWEYDINQFDVLCADCHQYVHEEGIFLDVLSRVHIEGPFDQSAIAYMVSGMLNLSQKPRHGGDEIMIELGQEAVRVYWRKLGKKNAA